MSEWTEQRDPQKGDSPLSVFVQGFGFTGSGALLDWMKDQPEICVSAKVKGFMGREGVGEMLLAGPGPDAMRSVARQRLAALEAQIRRRPLKMRLPGYRRGRALANDLKSALGLGRRTGVHMTSTEVEGLEGWERDRDWLRAFIAGFDDGSVTNPASFWNGWFRDRIRQYCPDASHVALDKCLPFETDRFDGLWEDVMDPARVVVAHRDPADQAAEIVRRQGWKKLARRCGYTGEPTADPAFGEHFLDWAEANLRRVLDYQRRRPDRCLAIPFEGFTGEPAAWSARVRAWLDLPQRPFEPGRFEPAVSRENVGIAAVEPHIDSLFDGLDARREALEALRGELDALSSPPNPDSPAP